MMSHPQSGRTIHVHREQWHLTWDRSITPIVTIASGETVSFDTLDASCGQIGPTSTVDAIRNLDFSRVDQVNGPIYVQGAALGDTLEIEFLDLQPADWGWTAIIPSFGLLADEFPEPALKIWHLEGGAEGVAEFAPGIRIPLAPFCSEIGLAPTSGRLSTIPPYRHGGNMDTKHLTKGAHLYLPVEVPGALFSLGDGHAAQGDGEVCGTAIETPMRATVRFVSLSIVLRRRSVQKHTVCVPTTKDQRCFLESGLSLWSLIMLYIMCVLYMKHDNRFIDCISVFVLSLVEVNRSTHSLEGDGG